MTRQFVEPVVFMQGDDASRVFDIMYSGHSGFADVRGVLQYLKEYVTDSDSGSVEVLDTYCASGVKNFRDFVLTWNYAYNWVALYRKVSKASLRKREVLALDSVIV